MQLRFLVRVLLPRLIANSDLPQLLLPAALPVDPATSMGTATHQPTWICETSTRATRTDTFVGVDGEITITGGPNSGHFSLALPAGYQNFVLALKSGSGQLDPDWVAFLLAPGTTEGDWTISSQGFSHALLYAQLCTECSTEKENVSENPIPGALWLFGTVIAGGAGYSRWRKKRKQTA